MNTNDSRFDLIRRCRDGEASMEELAQLESCLREDTDFRLAYVRYINLDVALSALVKTVPMPEATMPASRPHRNLWLSWRPLTAAAAGIVFGMFSASFVWGYVVPRVTRASSIWLPVAKGSFEEPMVPLRIGATPSLAAWSADPCAVVSAENGIEPLHRMHMLRALGSVAKNANGRPTLSGEFMQLVDMRLFKEQFADGCADLKCSAWFNAVADTGNQDYAATLEIYALRGNPSEVPASEPRNWLAREQIVRSMKRIIIDHDPAAWQASGVRVELPPETDFVAVTFRLAPTRPLMNTVPPAFPGHYVDHVRLALVRGAREESMEPIPTDSD